MRICEARFIRGKAAAMSHMSHGQVQVQGQQRWQVLMLQLQAFLLVAP